MILSTTFAALCVLFLALSGTSYVLMGLELRRRGREAPFLSLSVNPGERVRIFQNVAQQYRELKQQDHRTPVFYYLLWACMALAIVCTGLSFATMGRG